MGELKLSSYGFDSLREDEVYKLFLSKTFDSTSCVFSASVSINDQISKISSGIDVLNYELHSLISDHYEDLLTQTSKIERLDEYVKRVHQRVGSLLQVVERLRTRLTEPYNRIAHRMFLLTRLQRTCDLLRKIIRFVHLSKRLRQYSSDRGNFSIPKREIVKVSQYISELNGVMAGDQALRDVEVIQEDLRLCQTLQIYVVQQADEMLTSGLTKQDQNQLSSSLHVFQNLGILEEKLDKVVSERREQISARIRETFDSKNLSQSKSSGPGGVSIAVTVSQLSNLKGKLWELLESVVEQMYLSFSQIQCIYKALKKKEQVQKGTSSENLFRNCSLAAFVNSVNTLLSEQMSKAVNESSYIKEALEVEYPRLIRLFSELWKRITVDDGEVNLEQQLRSTLLPFESAYLSRSLCILYDAVNVVFADAMESAGNGSGLKSEAVVPTVDDIDTIVKAVRNELTVANVDDNLSKAVCKLISKTVQMFNHKCEQLTCNDGDSTQVIDRPSSGQILNATLAHRLISFKQQVESVLAIMNPNGMSSLESALANVDQLIKTILDPLNISIQDAIEAIILTIHKEDFKSQTLNQQQCSLYMKELEAFLTRVDADYLQLYPECVVIKDCAQDIANRTIELFVRHACIVRPIEISGRLRLAVDSTRLEEALVSMKWLADRSAKCCRALRAFKPLLSQDADSIMKSPIVGTVIPPSVVMTFLISNFGPPEMKLPHEVKGWSLSRYSRWLDERPPENEILNLIKISLEIYEKQIRQIEGKAFAPLYPIILKLLQENLLAQSGF